MYLSREKIMDVDGFTCMVLIRSGIHNSDGAYTEGNTLKFMLCSSVANKICKKTPNSPQKVTQKCPKFE